jgi:hypothetical protein
MSHLQGPRTNRKPAHRPVSAGPRRGNRANGLSDLFTRSRVSAGRLNTRMSRSKSSMAARATSTRATAQSASSGCVSPRCPCSRPNWARSHAPGIASSTSVTDLASGSASSSAVDSRERARVPSWTWIRSARRASFSAYSASSVMFKRALGASTGPILHGSWQAVYGMDVRGGTSSGGPSFPYVEPDQRTCMRRRTRPSLNRCARRGASSIDRLDHPTLERGSRDRSEKARSRPCDVCSCGLAEGLRR